MFFSKKDIDYSGTVIRDMHNYVENFLHEEGGLRLCYALIVVTVGSLASGLGTNSSSPSCSKPSCSRSAQSLEE